MPDDPPDETEEMPDAALDDLLGGLLIGRLLLEAVVSADAEVPVRVDRALGAEAAMEANAVGVPL